MLSSARLNYLALNFSLFFCPHLGQPLNFLLCPLLCDYVLMVLNDVLMHLHDARKVLTAVGTLARASVVIGMLLLHMSPQIGGLRKSVMIVSVMARTE